MRGAKKLKQEGQRNLRETKELEQEGQRKLRRIENSL